MMSMRIVWTSATGVDADAGGGVVGERIIDHNAVAWHSQQLEEPCILENPKDPTRLVMFYSGVPSTNTSLCRIGKAWALKSDPFTWHPDPANPVFSEGMHGWDSHSIRLDYVLYVPEEDAYYIYYSGTAVADAHNRIGLAICPAGEDGYSGITASAIRRYGDSPVLSPDPAEPFCETMVSQAAVWRERDAAGRWRWYLYHSYRGQNGVLPGIRLATSVDGKTWQRQFNADDPRRMGHLFPSTPDAYYEWHQVFKVDDTYVLSMEVGPNRGERWRTVLAVSRHPDKGWEQLDVDTALQTRWSGIYRDDSIYHVATPAFHHINGRWYLYAQACPLPDDRNYISGRWDLWAFACDRRIPSRPGCADLFIPGVSAPTFSNPLATEDIPWAEFEASFPPRRPAAPIVRHGITPGMSNQVQHPCLVPDPEDPRRVFLYFTGCPPIYTGGIADIPGPNPRGENTIRRMYADAAADLSLPESWTLDPQAIVTDGRNMDIAVAAFDSPKGALPTAAPSAAGVTVPPAIADDELLAEAYRAAAEQNVLRALNPKVFFGYFSVCADGKGHGHNTTYPGLDWGQSAEALLWLGRTAEVFASWEYVKSFQREDGLVPFAIIPDMAGKTHPGNGSTRMPLSADERGAIFVHWVPGNPLRTLANVTFLLLADAIWTQTGDRAWLEAQASSLRLAAEWPLAQITADGLMPGGGFYVERPTRLEFDGINQCYSTHALTQAAALLDAAGETATAARCRAAAQTLTETFRRRFWAGEHCVEYIHPEKGPISSHGLTDVDWAAIATGVGSAEQIAVLWPQLKDNPDFIYNGIPGGIATHPETYEDWEMQDIDRHDLAAMGRIWYLEYYCEYPANFIRIVHRFANRVNGDKRIPLAPI